jgi:hypothetical protein
VLGETRSRRAALVDMALHLLAFGVLSRGAMRHLSGVLTALGWPPMVLGESAFQFTASLFRMALGDGAETPRQPGMPAIASRALGSPSLMRVIALVTFLPEPPLLWPGLRAAAARLRKRAALA